MSVPKLKRKKDTSSLYIRYLAYAGVFLLCLITALCLHETNTVINTEQMNPSDGIVVTDPKKELRGKYNYKLDEKLPNRFTDTDKDTDTAGNLPKSITLRTSQGNIKVKLRPDLSLSSVQYIKRLLDSPSPCQNCRFYRAEKPGILQGILKKQHVEINKILGDCPEGFENTGVKHECPPWDPKCGCHGPIMKRGMIGWAAGEGGPDFFINSYKRDADWWNTDHTVWGEIAGEESMNVVMSFYELPCTKGQLTMLNNPVHIEISSP